MADSNITKRALAASLKSLMLEKPFSRISVGDICESCEMNRKSFYYHFRDKYDLVNWIFDKEYASAAKLKVYPSVWEQFFELCEYLYNNKDFYRQAFKIDGQNSFSETFTQYCNDVFIKSFINEANDSKILSFQEKMLSSSLKNAVELWFAEKECMLAAEFSQMFKACVINTASKITEASNR